MTPLDELLHKRHSIRAYTRQQVARELVEQVLVSARSAPSGANLQPGYFDALTGAALARLVNSLDTAIASDRAEVAEYSYFPEPLSSVHKQRQRDAGYALYDALGIARRDVAARKQQWLKNYRFFDAPVGIVVSIERDMGKGCYMDLGMALMALFASAAANGLGCTGIGALAKHADVVHEFLGLPQERLVVCGVALGYADIGAVDNTVRTDRASLEQFATLHGFELGSE